MAHSENTGRVGLSAGPRWQVWRSPEGQPRWARPVLLGIAALAAVLYAWNLRTAGYESFYSVAAKSMAVSWKAFLYGALDPRATITLDKLAGSFIPQALSVRLFGFHQWSLALPQVIEGVVTVLVSYRLVRRWAGATAGALAAGVVAVTPVLASMFGHAMEDGLLTMCLVLAADRYQHAVTTGRLRSLLFAGAWVGAGFQAKMLQAWMVLPALALGYLVAAPGGTRRRLGHLAAAGAVTLAVSLSWITLYSATPTADRPYIDGTTNNSAWSMVFGYNGLERFGLHVPGSLPAMGAGGQRPTRTTSATRTGTGSATGRGAGAGATGTRATGAASTVDGGRPSAGAAGRGGGGFGNQGWAKLLGTRMATQIGWLYPAALLSLIAGLWWSRRAPRTDLLRGGLVMWGTWLATSWLVLSVINVPHTAYLAILAPPIAALSATGIVLGWRAHRSGGPGWWLLPGMVAAETAWVAYLSWPYPTFLPWLLPLAVTLGAISTVALLLTRPTPTTDATPTLDAAPAADTTAARAVPTAGRTALLGPRRLGLAALVGAVAAMLIAPTAWAGSALDPRYDGSAMDAGAGPTARGGFGGTFTRTAALDRTPTRTATTTGRYRTVNAGTTGQFGAGDRDFAAFAGRGFGGNEGVLTAEQSRLLTYVTAHHPGSEFVFATDSWSLASPYITADGSPVLPMGGFSGSVPEPTPQRARALVAAGQLRYFLIGGGRGFGRRTGTGPTAVTTIDSWVQTTCTAVPPTSYGATTTTATAELYRCG